MGSPQRVIESRELLIALTLRDLQTKYRGSFLGWSWSLLNPLATLAIYGFVFGILFGAEAPVGQNSGLTGFAWFLLCAIIPWNFFAVVNNVGLTSIIDNAALVRRVAFPREILVFSNVAFALVQFGIELIVLSGVLVIVAGPSILPYIPLAALLGIVLAVFSSGIALALGCLAVYFRDLKYLWTIALQVWFFITPVVYPPSLAEDQLPNWAQTVLQVNPMVHFIGAFRDLLYHAQVPDFQLIGTVLLSSSASLIIGWSVFNRLSPRLPEEV